MDNNYYGGNNRVFLFAWKSYYYERLIIDDRIQFLNLLHLREEFKKLNLFAYDDISLKSLDLN